jgi:hypothetical protein
MGSSVLASRDSVVAVQFVAGADWLVSAAWEFEVCAQRARLEQKYAAIASKIS